MHCCLTWPVTQHCKSKPSCDNESFIKLPEVFKPGFETGHCDLCLTQHKFKRNILVINIKDFTGVCGRHLHESGKLRMGWDIICICRGFCSSPPTTPTLTVKDAGGRTWAAWATAPLSYALWISGNLLENCWLLFSSVHCGVGRGHVILYSKSNWDVLGFMVWEAVETFILFSFQHTHWMMWTTTEAIVSLSFLFLIENYI